MKDQNSYFPTKITTNSLTNKCVPICAHAKQTKAMETRDGQEPCLTLKLEHTEEPSLQLLKKQDFTTPMDTMLLSSHSLSKRKLLVPTRLSQNATTKSSTKLLTKTKQRTPNSTRGSTRV